MNTAQLAFAAVRFAQSEREETGMTGEPLDLTMARLIAIQRLLLRRPPVQEAPVVDLLPFRALAGGAPRRLAGTL